MDQKEGKKIESRKQRSRGRECAAAECNSFEYKSDGSRSGIHFFKFPMKKPTKARWCNLIKRQDGRDGFNVNENTVICEKHFRKSDIIRGFGGVRSRLKKGVEPSIFNWSSVSPLPRKPPKDRSSSSTHTHTSTTGAGNPETVVMSCIKTDQGLESTSPLGEVEFTCSSSSTEEGKDRSRCSLGDAEVVIAGHTQDKSTQTCFSFTSTVDSMSSDHSYAFRFEDITDINKLRQSIQEQLEVKEEMLVNLKQKVGQLQKEIDEYKQREFSLEKFKDDDSAVQFYTGFPNYKALLAFHNYLQPKVAKLQYWGQKNVPDSRPYQEEGKKKPGPKRQLSSLNELFIVLVRLKETVRRNMPQQFALYPTTRVIIDCTEVFVEVPSSMLAQSQTWSNYKHHNTFKVLIGISPNGQVIFVSKLWGGRVSDKCITEKSGLLQYLSPGDNVMADRGFEITNILPPGVGLNIPPFKGARAQLTAEEVSETVHIASVRIHVERAIGRIKNYHILDGTLPLTLAHIADQIFSVCAYLTNFLPPLLPRVKKNT